MMTSRLRRLEALLAAPRRIPISFAIVGVQKAATGTLYSMLARHRAVAGGPEKEVRFFIEDERDWDDPDYASYCRPARRPAVRVAGDATPAYLFWPRALERMHRYDPDMRLLATFRDPVERAFSQWSMERRRSRHYPDLPDALRQFEARHIPEEIPPDADPKTVRRESLVSRGLYGRQLERGLGVFPREQWLLIDFRDFLARPAETIDRATDHIGVRRFRHTPALEHRNAGGAAQPGRPHGVDDVRRLVDLYADDLDLFARLSGLDLSRWPTSRVLSGDLAVEEFSAELARRLERGS